MFSPNVTALLFWGVQGLALIMYSELCIFTAYFHPLFPFRLYLFFLVDVLCVGLDLES